jgi:hypothetical protein
LNPTPPHDTATPTVAESLPEPSDEIVAAVRSAVAQILDAPAEGAPSWLAEITNLRSAAVRIVEDEHLSMGAKYRLLGELADLVPNAQFPELARGALWEEVAVFYGARVPEPAPPTTWIIAQRRLRSQGFECCPLCRSTVMTERGLAEFEAAS